MARKTLLNSFIRLDVLLPIAITLVVAIAAFTIAHLQRQSSDTRLAEETRLVGSNFIARLQTEMDSRLRAGELLGQRFVETNDVDVEAFRAEATLTHDLFGDFQALSWVDTQGVIRIVTPAEGNEAALNLDLRQLPIPGETLFRAEATGKTQVTPPIELAQGGRGFAAYVPVNGLTGRAGFINIVFRSDPLLEHVAAESGVLPYALNITDDGNVVFQSVEDGRRPDLIYTGAVNVGPREWTIMVAPSAMMESATSNFLDEAIIVFGMLAAILLGGMTRLVFIRQASLREGETLLRDVTDTIDDVVWVSSSDFSEIRYINPAFERFYGMSLQEVRADAQSWRSKIDPNDSEKVASKIQAVSARLAEGNGQQFDRFEWPIFKITGPDGITRDLFARSVAMRDEEGSVDRWVGVATDISELLRAQDNLRKTNERLFQAQKMETIGQLTGGVAHDFNNLLYIILGNAELARDLTEDPAATEALDEIVAASKRGSDLTQNMLAFARRSQLSPSTYDLNTIVRDAQSWMTRALPESISVELSLFEQVWPVLIDRSALESALLNLLLNANDAMAGNGKLTIETANVHIDEAFIEDKGEDLVPGRYVMLAVSDNGTGIPEDRLPHIFDPFFTTKQASAGSGLGLSMVQGFTKQSGGTIRVYSELGVGTTFKLFLPVSANRIHTDEPEQDIPKITVRDARILLVEDETGIRNIVAKQLRAEGYEVIVAKNGDEGLRMYGSGEGIDLVITDLVMPGSIQGPTLAKLIRSRKPEERFIFISGYANKSLVHGGGLSKQDARLTKPISKSELILQVRRALDEPH